MNFQRAVQTLKIMDIEEAQVVMDFILDFVVTKLLVPGRVESWVMLSDAANVGITDVPSMTKLGGKDKINASSHNFKGRCFRTYCVNVGWTFRAVFAMVKGFLDEY